MEVARGKYSVNHVTVEVSFMHLSWIFMEWIKANFKIKNLDVGEYRFKNNVNDIQIN